MLVATFGPTTAWQGKTIDHDGAGFVLQDHGPIDAAGVLDYDRQGHLQWVSEETFATIALQAGVPVTVVSKYLGHSSVTMTLNVYSHVLRGASQELANTVADVIRKGAF